MIKFKKLFKEYDDIINIYDRDNYLLYYIYPNDQFDFVVHKWFKKGYNDKHQIIYESTPTSRGDEYVTTYTYDEYGEMNSWNSSDGTWAKFEHNCAGSVIYEEYSEFGIKLDNRKK